MVGRRSPSYMRKEVEEEEEQYHSTSHPWVLERHPSMVCRYVTKNLTLKIPMKIPNGQKVCGIFPIWQYVQENCHMNLLSSMHTLLHSQFPEVP